ncbi:hypothetical protein EDB89DRAFT_1902838 [Lactarius sanguifluus]|nr:hypothetical protein EDB89DRAFT_1902838 [Lactarius sanguifluus]
MVKYYYTVIVGTKPGVYDDWAQAGPTVTGISGAIHRKYNTEREAWEAFDIAVCDGKTPQLRVDGDPENASRNTSSPVSAVDLVTSIGVDPLRRTTSEYHGNSGQPLRTMTSSGSSHSVSSPSSPVGPGRVYEHAGFPRRGFGISWPGENRRINEQGTAGSPGASNTATQHGEAGAVGTSREIGQRTRESHSPAQLRLSQTGHLIHEVPGGSQVEDISETAARYRQILDHFLAPGAQATIGSDYSPIPSTLGDQLVDHDEGQESRSRVWDFVLGRARSQGDDNDRRASLQSVDTSLDSPDSMQRVHNNHTQLQNTTESPYSLGAPNLSPLSSSSPRGAWPNSSPSHFSFEASPSTASGLGLLTGVASPHRHSLPQSPAAQDFPGSLVGRSVRSIDAHSPTRDTESSRDPPQQDQASSPHLTVATPEDTQSIRTGLIDRGSLSHRNIPLPQSPVSSAPDSYPRLQAQPAHRRSPRMPMYPSLPSQDPELLSLSDLDIGFGLPTPRLSPTQAQAVVRPPSMDPRSPVPTRMRIPGDIMEYYFSPFWPRPRLMRPFLFQTRLFWPSYPSSKYYANVSLIAKANVDSADGAPAWGFPVVPAGAILRGVCILRTIGGAKAGRSRVRTTFKKPAIRKRRSPDKYRTETRER